MSDTRSPGGVAAPLAFAAAVALAAGPALAQYTAGGVPEYDPNTLASNLLVWAQPLLTAIAIAITIAACAGSANEPRRVGAIAGAGVFAIGLIWGFPYIPRAMNIAVSALSRA